MRNFVKMFFKHYLLKINSRQQIFVLGDGRSGTTWIADVLNFDRKYFEFFEPFHGRRILNLSNDRLYPTEKDIDELFYKVSKLEDHARNTKNFAGLIKPRRVALSGSILKDISSHLILPNIQDSRRKNILIIRNPISVALSKEKYGKWHNRADIKNLLNQSPKLQKLGSRCLSKNMIATKFLEFVFVWCLIHRITLANLGKIEFFIIFYENMLREPEASFEELFCYLGQQDRFNENGKKILACVNKNSRTATENNKICVNLTDERPWDGQKSDHEISRAYDILKTFDLYDIYMETVTPKVTSNYLKKYQ